MAITTDDTTTIELATIGADVPDGTTIDVRPTRGGLEVDRRDETFIIEGEGSRCVLTGVIGRDEMPDRVPDWLEAALRDEYGIKEVVLGR
ncbi:hypothetical protein [Natrinema versiforme]|uniref:Uncharacterized protein n=1 Tax=Natrinema versiforme JCM 10478 TaxID=1227496 RepID=L9Y554_9EURY|nr:hypothetical protein [Natrinema versiforme]ELY68857.1 hypothetical protein C489_05808 [Natrinema versiforme JCM 10478]